MSLSTGSQHYSLRWNNHQSHLLAAFDALLQNESLVDCTIMCEDAAVRAHKVVLSACSPYFQKIFIDNPGKHPIIVLKDVLCWEMQCILDFMYKGETSVPESQLTGLIKAAESLKVRGLTSSDQLPPGVSLSSTPTNLSSNYRGYSPSPSPHHRYSEGPMSKHPHMSGNGPHSNDSSPLSLSGHPDHMSDRASGRASPVPSNGPRRKQARPRRRSGDSVNSSLDLSKAGSPPLSYGKRESPSDSVGGDEAENLSIRRSHSPGHAPAINLVKMEQLVDGERRMEHDNISDTSLGDRDCDSSVGGKLGFELGMDRPVLSNGIHHLQEQALNFMASGGGLPHHPLLPPHGHSPLHGGLGPHPFPPIGLQKPNPPTSSSNAYTGSTKAGLEYQRISIDRSKLTEDEAFEHAIDMISSRQMGFRKAADFFQVSKWKLYKTARKRGIYAEIKKQNQAHALSKVPTNVQHFAEMGVYKQIKKKEEKDMYVNKDMYMNKDMYAAKDVYANMPRNLSTFKMEEDQKIYKSFPVLNAPSNIINNNNNNNNNNNLPLKLSNNINFDKRYHHLPHPDHMKPFIPIQPAEMQKPLEVKGPAPLPFPSPYLVKYGSRMEEPIQLVKEDLRLREDDRRMRDEDDDDEDRLLVIAHRESSTTPAEEDSDHGSSDRAEDSV